MRKHHYKKPKLSKELKELKKLSLKEIKKASIQTIEKKSNFINLKGGYYNVGKYKGAEVNRPPVDYLDWLLNKSMIVLNKGEITLINKLIKTKNIENEKSK
jgi:hypothetical protein